jgi:hypothetical protein
MGVERFEALLGFPATASSSAEKGEEVSFERSFILAVVLGQL